MKKILTALITVVAAVATFAATNVITNLSFDQNETPANVKTIKLGTCNSGPYDTIPAASANVYGPYNLSHDATRSQYNAFQFSVRSDAVSAGDSLQAFYQVLPAGKLSDTTSWIACDTLIKGKQGNYISLASKVGQAIAFKLYGIDASTVLIAAPIRVVFKGTEVERTKY